MAIPIARRPLARLVLLSALGALAGCVVPPPPFGGPAPYGRSFPPGYGAPPAPAAARPAGDLQSARLACNTAYPPRVGNYLPHAQCVNAAVENFALAGEPYPDLLRVQENARLVLSGKVDNGTLSVQDGERRMAEADALVAAARRSRNAGNPAEGEQQLGKVDALLQ